MRTRIGIDLRQNISIVAILPIGGLVSINARRRIPCAAVKRSHSGNRTAICILTSYAFRQNSYCSITVLRCRPMKLIPACRTPHVSLPNMASLFLPRKTRRQDIISSIFHNRPIQRPVSSGLLPRVDRIGRYPVARNSTHTSKSAHPRPRQTHEGPFWREPTSYNQPPRGTRVRNEHGSTE